MKVRSTVLVVGSLATAVACGGSDATPASTPDARDAAGADAGAPASDAAFAADVPEPAWSGTTVEPGCQVNGCILDFQSVTTIPQGLLATSAGPGFTVENGVSSYTIRYYSDGDEITGSVFVPDMPAPEGGFPVVVMNQFTSGIGEPCAPSQGNLGLAVASTTAMHGILTLVPDAPSYGPPPTGAYLVASVSGRAALDGVRAAFHLAPALGLPVARRAVIAGLSQGAHSTMAAAAEMATYAPNLEVRGFAAAEPPSNLRGADNAVLQGNADVPVFLPMRMWSWQRFYGLGGEPVFKEPYASQVEGWFQTDCLFMGSNGRSGTLESHFAGAPPSAVVSDVYLEYARTDQWPEGWSKALDASTPMPHGAPRPIVVFQGTADATVPKSQTDAYVAALRAAGTEVDYRVAEGGTHGTTALSSFTVAQVANDDALAWIREHLTP